MSEQDIVERLRGNYVIPINDGAGPLNGSYEYRRHFDTPPIHHEAAEVIEWLREDLAAANKRIAELEATATLGAAIRALPADKRSFIEIRRNPDNSGLHEWAMTTIYDDGRYSTQVGSTPEEMLADEVAIHGGKE